MRLFGEALGLGRHLGLAGEQLGIVLDQHAAAGAARRDDVVAILERLDRLARQRLGGRPVAGIVGGLAAAGLRRHDDPAAGVLEELDGGEADGRAHEVDEAGDEQADTRRMARPSPSAAVAFMSGP